MGSIIRNCAKGSVFQMYLLMTFKSSLQDHNGNKGNYFLFFVSSLVVIGKPWNVNVYDIFLKEVMLHIKLLGMEHRVP